MSLTGRRWLIVLARLARDPHEPSRPQPTLIRRGLALLGVRVALPPKRTRRRRLCRQSNRRPLAKLVRERKRQAELTRARRVEIAWRPGLSRIVARPWPAGG